MNKADGTFRIVTDLDSAYLLLRQGGHDLDLAEAQVMTVYMTRARQATSTEEFLCHLERSTFILN